MTKPLDPIEPTTATYPAHTPAQGSACQNCQTMLQGGYCHVCGQHAHNPLRSFRHAMEDVFESFWHVDGRIFRTLRDLLVPGKISREYLNGHRVRYIPPLRLYVILSLITFFVAHFLTANLQGGFASFDEADNPFVMQVNVVDVERERDSALAKLDQSLKEARATKSAVAITTITAARDLVETQAQARIDELSGKATPSVPTIGNVVKIKADESRAAGGEATSTPTSLGTTDTVTANVGGGLLAADTEDALSKTAEANARLFAKDKRAFVERVLTHIPTTLLVLVPLFALVLRIVYLLRPMGYLEHLVVALYSHAFLLLVALAWISMLLLDRAMGGAVLGVIAAAIFPLLIPIYLLLSQKRVYAEAWWKTLLRFGATSFAYFVLATLATAAVFSMALLLKA